MAIELIEMRNGLEFNSWCMTSRVVILNFEGCDRVRSPEGLRAVVPFFAKVERLQWADVDSNDKDWPMKLESQSCHRWPPMQPNSAMSLHTKQLFSLQATISTQLPAQECCGIQTAINDSDAPTSKYLVSDAFSSVYVPWSSFPHGSSKPIMPVRRFTT
uniref:Uncharacterized protein n=1 Tax=Rhizophora mucronata TaxID=61149 RepID=A0A2P2QQX4_RHIMU